MLPPRRLRNLLKQAVQHQAEKCSCHDVCWRTDLENVSLLTDHDCGTESVRHILNLFDLYFFQRKNHLKYELYF